MKRRLILYLSKKFEKIKLFFRKLKKVFFFISLWGFRSTFFKILGRTRIKFIKLLPYPNRNVLILGCGQFAFSTLSPKLLKFGLFSPIKYAFDIDEKNLKTFCYFYSCLPIKSLKNLNNISIAYICSSHSSHFEYTKNLLERNINVYCEKPLTTNRNDLFQLSKIIRDSKANLYSGYNRPHSPIIKKIKNFYDHHKPEKFNASLTIFGHKLNNNHWYRNTNEGSRIYGNLSHWIDLSHHIMNWDNRKIEKLSINIQYIDSDFSDENLICTLKSSNGFTFLIAFYAKCEPFGGVYENIEISTNKFNARIKNFKSLEIEDGISRKFKNFPRKNAGHYEAINQPKLSSKRSYLEFLMSEILISYINEMTISRSNYLEIDYQTEFEKLI